MIFIYKTQRRNNPQKSKLNFDDFVVVAADVLAATASSAAAS